jgi:hypothetical protein
VLPSLKRRYKFLPICILSTQCRPASTFSKPPPQSLYFPPFSASPVTAHPVGHFPLWAGPGALRGLGAALRNCSSATPSPEHYRTFARHELELQSFLARVRLESVALTGKILSAVGCHPLAGCLATPAAESVHRTSEPHPHACSWAVLQPAADHC